MALPGMPASQVPSGLDDIYRRFADLERQLRELGPSIAASFAPVITDLQNQQATLTSQQTQLSNQLASITRLVNEQVSGDASTATTSGVSLTGSATAYASASVTVPSGFTKATVMAVSAGVFTSSSASAAHFWTRIASSDGNDPPLIVNGWESASASHATNLTGLTAGSTITASSMSYQGSGSISCVLTTSMVVIYFR